MLNVNMRIRCISEASLEAIMELLREESNAIFIETFTTQEELNTSARASVNTPYSGRGGLGSAPRKRRRSAPAA